MTSGHAPGLAMLPPNPLNFLSEAWRQWPLTLAPIRRSKKSNNQNLQEPL